MLLTLMGNIGMFGEQVPIDRLIIDITSEIATAVIINSAITDSMEVDSSIQSGMIVRSKIDNRIEIYSPIQTTI